eukprot:TRINITY_DN7703_c0_g1_i5.p1 TRINITY_DN7703_c0_g1~~TRINITY_DN7703_c0_g1_i5.p1  ORF type:complete len:531 (+),score=92.12 TRINITY_DN7703_c0_g1_i5:68-1660(+)
MFHRRETLHIRNIRSSHFVMKALFLTVYLTIQIISAPISDLIQDSPLTKNENSHNAIIGSDLDPTLKIPPTLVRLGQASLGLGSSSIGSLGQAKAENGVANKINGDANQGPSASNKGAVIYHVAASGDAATLSGTLLGLSSAHLLAAVFGFPLKLCDPNGRLSILTSVPRMCGVEDDNEKGSDAVKQLTLRIPADRHDATVLSPLLTLLDALMKGGRDEKKDEKDLKLDSNLENLVEFNSKLAININIHASQPFTPLLFSMHPGLLSICIHPSARLCEGWTFASLVMLGFPFKNDKTKGNQNQDSVQLPPNVLVMHPFTSNGDLSSHRTVLHQSIACASPISFDAIQGRNKNIIQDSQSDADPSLAVIVPVVDIATGSDAVSELSKLTTSKITWIPVALNDDSALWPLLHSLMASHDLKDSTEHQPAIRSRISIVATTILGATAPPQHDLVSSLLRALTPSESTPRGIHFGHCFTFPSRHPVSPALLALLKQTAMQPYKNDAWVAPLREIGSQISTQQIKVPETLSVFFG